MSSIDERIVQMKFDNSQFQSGVSATTSALDKLKQGLNLDGAAKSLQGLDAAGKSFSLAGMATGVDAIASKFSALSVLGITALVNIGNQAINTGINLVKSLTIAPIADGFSDYNAKLTSVQTIMNATGASIETVSSYFSELDTYADKTIYNLKDMTGAFAKFTNAGIDMDKSVPAIKGIANMVALAGQDAGAASIAMYNLSQSMAGGFLTTTDYKSLNLANVATKEWKDQMIAGAIAAGTLEKKADDMYHIVGTKAGAASSGANLFNESLKEGWATTDVMVKVLGDYGDTTTDIGKKAQAAAQDVKSWGMMMETLSAGVGTGWTDTFEILLGNITEAKALFTPLTATIGGFLDEMSAARNEPLKEWKELGGRTVLIDAVKSAFTSLMAIMGPIKDAFVEIFPPTTGKNLMSITNAIKDFVAKLVPSFAVIDGVKRTAKGLFAALDIGKMIIMGVVEVIGRLLGSVAGTGIGFLGITAKIGDFLVEVRNAIKYGTGLTDFFDNLGTVLIGAIEGLKNVAKWMGDLFGGFAKVDTSIATTALGNVTERVESLKEAGSGITRIWEGFLDIVKGVFGFFAPLGQKIADVARDIGTGIASAMKGVDFNTVLDGINTGLFAGLILMVRKFFKGGFADEDGGGLLDKIKGVFGGLTDTLDAMQTTLKAGTLILIAGAIALLAGSVLILSTIDSGKLTIALAAIGAMMAQLMIAMFILDKISSVGGAVKITILAAAMSLFAIAIGILAVSVKAMSSLSWEELLKGLGGVLALLFGIAGALKMMSGVKGNLVGAGVGMIAIAIAIKILASAVKDFSELSWAEMAKGLTGVGAVLGALTIFSRLAKANKGAMGSAAGLILLGVALKIIASVVKDFSAIGASSLIKGLGAITLVLAALAGFSRVVNPSGMVSMGIAMVILGSALKILASAISDFADMSWEQLVKGGVGLAGTLVVIAAAMRLMPSDMLSTAASLVIVGAALKIIASALKDMGGMSWDEIGRGMVVLGGSLLVIAAAMKMMTGAIPGAFALIIVAGALAILAPILMAFGAMGWEAIIQGLTMLAGTFAIIGLAGLLLTPVIPSLMALGIAISLLGLGAVLAGVGLLAFSVGLTALSIAGAAGAAALVAIVSGLLGLLPMAFTQVGLALVAFAVVIGESAPALVGAFVAILLAILDGIGQVAPAIIGTFMNLILLLVNAIVVNVPVFINAMLTVLFALLGAIETAAPAVINTMIYLITSLVNAIIGMISWFVDAGMRLILGILTGIGNNIGKIVDAGANIIVEFLNGIARNIPTITQAAANVIITFVESLATAIRNNTSRMNAAGADLAGAIIEGMTSGIRNGITSVVNAARDMAGNALQAAKDFLNINSPSKKFIVLGEATGEGFVKGIDNYGGKVANSATAMGAMAVSTLSKTLSGLGDNVRSDLDMTPTIRPVLDLSSIKKDSGLIAGMLNPPTLDVGGAYDKATILSNNTQDNTNITPPKGIDGTSEGSGNITFIQNNHSPKAISNIDMYRQTRNQLSIVKKGALVK